MLRSRYLAILAAIVSQRRLETRPLMLFWHLADRFGWRLDGKVPPECQYLHDIGTAGEPVARLARG